jgi:transcriptional regulator with XRE-family HTH domain
MTDDKYKKLFSKNLNYYMTLKGKTQTDIINDLDINKSAISSWCNGTRLPRMNKVQLLADYLNINVSDLIEGSCENNNYFEFITEDDSMFPLLDVGDIALIYKQNKIDATDNKNKGTYLLKLNGKNTIRKIVLNEENNTYQLVAMNTCCKTTYVSIENIYNEITILGKVVKAENESAFK